MTNAKFWDRIAKKYARTPIKDEAYYQETLERSLSYLTPDSQVLEVGCGTGNTAIVLAKKAGHVTATDISGAMLDIARAKPGADTVTFIETDVLGSPKIEGGYDAVFAHSLLHLVPDLPATLNRIAQLTKPGGVFISKTVSLQKAAGLQFTAMKIMVKLMQAFGRAPFVRFMQVSELESAIEAAGFEIVEAFHKDVKIPARYVVARKL